MVLEEPGLHQISGAYDDKRRQVVHVSYRYRGSHTREKEHDDWKNAGLQCSARRLTRSAQDHPESGWSGH
jgi:hypothetical protein